MIDSRGLVRRTKRSVLYLLLILASNPTSDQSFRKRVLGLYQGFFEGVFDVYCRCLVGVSDVFKECLIGRGFFGVSQGFLFGVLGVSCGVS